MNIARFFSALSGLVLMVLSGCSNGPSLSTEARGTQVKAAEASDLSGKTFVGIYEGDTGLVAHPCQGLGCTSLIRYTFEEKDGGLVVFLRSVPVPQGTAPNVANITDSGNQSVPVYHGPGDKLVFTSPTGSPVSLFRDGRGGTTLRPDTGVTGVIKAQVLQPEALKTANK